ncbi:MAG: hypothetical protein ACM3OO_02305 [Planctomycetaceae bacterium]
MAREQGGVVLKSIGWLVVLAVLASAGLFAFVQTQTPLALGAVKVGANAPAGLADPAGPARYRPGGKIYVATYIRNTGRLTVTLRGLGTTDAPARAPYVPTELLLGSGVTTNPDAATTFSDTSLAHGVGVGVLIVYTTNPDLVCGLLPADAGAKPVRLPGVPIRYTTYGIDRTQTLTSKGLPEVAPPTRGACEAARTASSG